MDHGDLPDGAADAPCHGRAGALGGTAERARPAAEAKHPGERLDQRIHLGTGTGGTCRVVVALGLVDLALEVVDALAVPAPGPLVEHLLPAGHLGRTAGQVQAMALVARPRQQERQVVQALRVRKADAQAVERQRPRRAVEPELAGIGTVRVARPDGDGGAVVIRVHRQPGTLQPPS